MQLIWPFPMRERPGTISNSGVFVSVVVGCALLLLTYATGSVLDYPAYVRQWQNILAGLDPWAVAYDALGQIPTNAYGPVHVIFAEMVRVHPLLPKFVTAFCTLLVFGLAFALNTSRDARIQSAVKLAWLYTLSPLVIITVFVFGINDGVVGVLLLMACLFRARDAYGWTGVFLGLAALLKFYPILFTPFFAVARTGTLRLRVLIGAGATFALGMGLAWAHWGQTAFSPFLFGDQRGPKHLSILRYLDTVKDELSIQLQIDYLLEVNSLAVVGVAVMVFLWGWLTRQGWEVTSLLGILAIFMTYKVGHQQFYVAWMAVYAWIIATSSDERAVFVARSFTPVAVFLALYQVLYYVSYLSTGFFLQGNFVWFRVFGSLALLIVVLWCLRSAAPRLGRTAGPPVSVRL